VLWSTKRTGRSGTRKRARLASTFSGSSRRQLPDSVSQAGFKKYLRKGIVVNLNEAMTLDIPLVVGDQLKLSKLLEHRHWWIRRRRNWVQW